MKPTILLFSASLLVLIAGCDESLPTGVPNDQPPDAVQMPLVAGEGEELSERMLSFTGFVFENGFNNIDEVSGQAGYGIEYDRSNSVCTVYMTVSGIVEPYAVQGPVWRFERSLIANVNLSIEESVDVAVLLSDRTDRAVLHVLFGVSPGKLVAERMWLSIPPRDEE